MSDAPASVSTDERSGRAVEVVVAILLGVVSVTSAWAAFQASLYSGLNSTELSLSQVSRTEADSLYLEASQAQGMDQLMWGRLTEVTVDFDSPDPAVVAAAESRFDTLLFNGTSVRLQEAIDRITPGDNPLEDPTYLDELYGPSEAKYAETEQHIRDAARYNVFSDYLTLSTVMMAIALFLLGITNVFKRRALRWLLVGFAVVTYLVAGVILLLVPVASI